MPVVPNIPQTQTGASDDPVSVLLPRPLASAYDYLAPPGRRLRPGDYVLAPLGRDLLPGVVWGQGSGDVPREKLRALAERYPVPPMPDSMRQFIDWVSEYVLSPVGAVLRMALPHPDALVPPPPEIRLQAAATPLALNRLTPARRRVMAIVAEGGSWKAPDLAQAAACGSGVVRGLVASGALEPVSLPLPAPPRPDPDHHSTALNAEQEQAAETLVNQVASNGFGVTVLDGVTGSGKTEVYFEAIAQALRAGRQVLVLLPEIALSAPWLDRFTARFGVAPVTWHSDLSQKERRRHWHAIANGTAAVVIGARSALFLPHRNLGLIVVDEEHEAAFKQEDGVAYHARDMAVARARFDDIPVVLASATPSLETHANVWSGRYQSVGLSARHGGATLPSISAIDLRRESPPRGSFLSPPLVQAMEETVERGEQALLFLNRRGYAPLTLCRTCGHRFGCPDCSTWLVEHRLAGRMVCHHCGYSARLPTACPECGSTDSLVACGPGVERIEEEVNHRFPTARTVIMASDRIRGPADAAAIVHQIKEHGADIIIGTQLIAKGYHFPLLTLVGVVDADLGLAGGDLRAAERTYQLLSQVSGRAGRAERPGSVLLQTHDPDQAVMAALIAGDREGFLRVEAEGRQRFGLPPYGKLVALIVSGPKSEAVNAVSMALRDTAPALENVRILGPSDAPLAVLRGRHRRRFLIKAPRNAKIQSVVGDWIARIKIPANVRVAVDVDPYSFL